MIDKKQLIKKTRSYLRPYFTGFFHNVFINLSS